MERQKINCPNCGAEIVKEFHEFVDAGTDPEYKEQILNGQFFLAKCKECGDDTLVEYTMMYMDPEKKLNVYMAPEHDDELLEQLNSLEIPTGDEDAEAKFRVVSNSAELIEKILLADGNRDDRIMELYKIIVIENIKNEWPGVENQDLLYFIDEEKNEYLIFWDFTNAEGEQLTVDIDPELYENLEDDYLEQLTIPANKYAEVDRNWIEERMTIEE